ncbi:sensor histidine kinase ['Paenibacillus yunnanensis' Narsing Rao et al. 2020]|uniref:sensor histidine kinase n=1 Tax=Paenibacillus tengchongensis TaxID=2608684 RepID=UPI00124D7BF3|nr:HAMP domain-containing sensor histidine kinase [Paenibacillus tengchongensis]
MHPAISIIAALAAVFLLMAYALQRHSIIQVRKQLADADSLPVQHRHIRLPLPGHEMEQLVVAVNGQLEQRRQEQALHEARELAVKAEIANLSHDLRTPLTSMQGYAGLLQNPAVPAAEREEYLDIILHKLAVMNNIVESFYELSSMDSGDYPLSSQPLYLYSLLSEVILAFHTDLDRKNIEVRLQLDETVKVVPLDEKAMIRIFSNVLQNVLRYGKSRLAISLFTEADSVKIVFVNDTDQLRGQEVSRLFERTYTGDPSRSSGQLGLGLAIVKQLVEKQGGSLGAQLADGEFQLVFTFGE